ncbi:MAG TPA: DUF1178 domain-containing protein [Rhodobacteraceae bacterium]|jgi:hypothetical protein|nr:DUF1178 domain-containing protein [Paracoccaceae bacterium]HBV55620.1 DUF1178 domain-containing protein [Paracoccaceae bacterium]
MIRFSLHCTEGHQFDSWFQNAGAFETLKARGLVACATCGSTKVEKALMAPAVSTKEGAARPLSEPAAPEDTALRAMKAHLEANSEYVGLSFASEARKMHAGEAPDRAIWGEAKPEEAKKLLEEGVPVAPLPFMPKRKTN